jgi:lipoteichoic acid synthase
MTSMAAYANYDITGVFFSGGVAWNWSTLFRILKVSIFALTFPAVLVILINFLPASRRTYWAFAALTLLLTISNFAIVLYADYFSKILNFGKLSDAENLHSVASQITGQLIKPHNIFLLLCGLAGVALLIRQLRRRAEVAIGRRLLAFCCAALLAYLALIGLQLWRFGSPVNLLISHGGMTTLSHFGFAATYTSMLVRDTTPPDPSAVVAYPDTVNGHVPRMPDAPKLTHPNIFMVQVESLDRQVIDLCIDNKQVMPFLHDLKSQCVFCDTCFAHHNGGGSSDAELATLLSILPIVAHNGNATALYPRIDALSQVLKRNNYFISAFHPNIGSYYHRNTMYSIIGADRFFDADWFTGLARGWHANDQLFFEQSFKLLKQHARPPFLAYFITIQSHGPFQNYDKQAKNCLDFSNDGSDRIRRDYLSSMHEVDGALSRFFQLIKEQYPEGNNLVFIYGDHTSGVIDKPLKGTEHIPLLIVHPSLRPEVISEPVSLIDLAPTIAHLLSIEPGKTWLGDSVFTVGPRQVALIDLTRITRSLGNLVIDSTCDSLIPFRRYSRYLQGVN